MMSDNAGAQLRPRDEMLAMIDKLVADGMNTDLALLSPATRAQIGALSEAAERIRADAAPLQPQGAREALSIAERHAAKWRKAARKHKRAGGYRSDHGGRDLARAEICDDIAADLRALALLSEPPVEAGAAIDWEQVANARADTIRDLAARGDLFMQERDILVNLHRSLMDVAQMREHTARDFVDWMNSTRVAAKDLTALSKPEGVAEGDIEEIISRGTRGEKLTAGEQSAWTAYELGWSDGRAAALSPSTPEAEAK